MIFDKLARWPALEGLESSLPERLDAQRGVWGKLHGAPTDYRWLAATPNFLANSGHLERCLTLGPEDEPRDVVSWWVSGDRCHAVASYESRARDASLRTGFVEKQILSWRRPAGVPAALGALILLPEVAKSSDEIWWSHREDAQLLEDGRPLSLSGESFAVSGDAIESVLDRGLEQLREIFSNEVLTELLAQLLAGCKAVPAGSAMTTLPAEAAASLLLALPRQKADRTSIAGAFLSSHGDPKQGRSWDVVAGAPWPPPEPSAWRVHRAEAQDRVNSLLTKSPEGFGVSPPAAAANAREEDVEIALWGPASAGKTVLIAQLYLFIESTHQGEAWEIFPDRSSVALIQKRREQMHRNNLFPQATLVGSNESVLYNFVNRKTHRRASMMVEDRAGADYESLHEDVRERLQSARGLVLLFDPDRNPTQLELEVAKTLEEVHVSRGDQSKDPRPIAVCISKADTLIKTSRDYDQAIEGGERFVRSHMDSIFERTLDRFCMNYRLFPVSAAGVKRLHGVIEPTVFYDERLTPRLSRGGIPLNLMKPFSWVLEEVMAS